MARERELTGPDFNIISGDDDLTFKMLTAPDIMAQGVISVISNIAPAAVKAMVQKARSGDVDGASRLHAALSPLFGTVTVKAESERILPGGAKVAVQDRFRNPLPVKCLMNALGMPYGPGRQPLGRMSAEGVAVLRNAVKQVWKDNPEILAPIGKFYNIDIEARIMGDSCWADLRYV
jgi:4-hydroxy-tetrahydrodipicolinate synthase